MMRIFLTVAKKRRKIRRENWFHSKNIGFSRISRNNEPIFGINSRTGRVGGETLPLILRVKSQRTAKLFVFFFG